EWSLSHVYFAGPDEPGSCLCSHYPIIEHCVLHNRENGNTAVVGNVCVTRFLGINSEAVFAGLRRVTRDVKAGMSGGAVEYAYSKGWINDWERRFYLDTLRKRQLSPKQRAKRAQVNGKVLSRVTREEGRRDA